MNTLLENAIQEAMAELDKKSEGSGSGDQDAASQEINEVDPIVDTPKRSKKLDKLRSKDKHHKRNPAKVDGNRLRSSR